ncbi:RNA polymerase sigma-70 factor [Pedobacter gandavensis]|uniref:RNA polymerase sigma-70 factor n=1 Tax=Pedobacter gandavensis TaxID=2679963 RepID=UPI0029304B4D|nr:RNA polymerase sigma-70 factor [Pedobacter gandavensis]
MKQLDKVLLEKLVVLLSEGDTAAFNELYYRYKGKIHQFAYRFVRCSETAAELTQLVFVRLWKYKHTVDATKDFDAFLLTITRNLVYKEFQRKAKAEAYQNELARQERTYDPVASFTDLQDYRNLAEKAIESLPPQSKKVFKLSREQGASYEHISNELNISKNTVHSHMAKSLSHIRQYFKIHTPETVLVWIPLLYTTVLALG